MPAVVDCQNILMVRVLCVLFYWFVNQIQNIGEAIYYSTIGDFKIKDYIVEIGGKNKSSKQIKNEEKAFIVADDVLTGSKNIIPLYLFGFLY